MVVHIHLRRDHVMNHDLGGSPAYDLTILIEMIPYLARSTVYGVMDGALLNIVGSAH